MTFELKEAIDRVRTVALKLKVRTPQDALTMTVGNTLPLMAAERGIRGIHMACRQIIDNLVGNSADKKALRVAVNHVLALLRTNAS